MEEIKKILKERESYLLQLKIEKEKALNSVPEGSLRICCHGDNTQYYHRTDPKDFSGTYISKKETEFIHKLAQKDYDQRILKSIEKELQEIRKYIANAPERSFEKIYESLHKEKQKLITPIIEPQEQYVRNWESVVYQGKEMDESIPEIYTAKGERVRSKSEVIIADILFHAGIPYRYEYPIFLKGWGQVYPDFTVLNVNKRKEIIWEHLGMMDDPGYVENALKKIELYEQNGIYPGDSLILTYETKKNPINQKVVRELINHYLKDEI